MTIGLKYQRAELLGREKFESLLKELGIKQYHFTEDAMNRIDCIINDKSNIGVEIKNRDIKFEKYNTYIMEKSKLEYMRKLIKEKQVDKCWMVYFFDNVCYVFTTLIIEKLIKKNIITELIILLPNSTVNKKADVLKAAFLLPKEYAFKLKKEDNWKIIYKPKKL